MLGFVLGLELLVEALDQVIVVVKALDTDVRDVENRFDRRLVSTVNEIF